MRRVKVFIPEVICEESHEALRKVADIKVGKDGTYTEEELAEEVKDADAVLTTSRYRFTGKVIASAKKLKIIAKYGAKPDNIDIEAATRKGVLVTWTPSTNDESVAEHTIALMLALSKNLPFLMQHIKNGGWRSRTSTMTHELLGKTVGMVGLGAVGRKVVGKLKGFSVKMLVYDPYISEEHVNEVGARKVDLDTLLRKSDIVTVHAALTEDTRGLIGERELKKMKRNAFIVNTARGSIINEEALCKALENRWISGAALDVFEREPPSRDSSLFGLKNVVLTPHIAAWTHESLRRQAFLATEDVLRFFKGQTPKHVLNPEVSNYGIESR